jgi:hypothetical protein
MSRAAFYFIYKELKALWAARTPSDIASAKQAVKKRLALLPTHWNLK